MTPAGTRPLGPEPLVVIVALAALHLPRSGPRRNQGIVGGGFGAGQDRVERKVSRVELEAGVGLRKLTRDFGGNRTAGIRMAAEAKLVFAGGGAHDIAAGIHTFDLRDGSRDAGAVR